MNMDKKNPNITPKTNSTHNPATPTAMALDALEPLAGDAAGGAANDDGGPLGSANDNATPRGALDTTALVARPDVVRYIRGALRRYGVSHQDMADAIADVQVEAIEAARTRRMPANRGEWRALAVTVAVRRGVDRLREEQVRGKYDAGPCDDADAYAHPTLHREQRDPVDTKRYLAILKDLFDSGQMPKDAAEILW